MAEDNARRLPLPYDVSFTLGARRVAEVRRNLAALAFSLEDALARHLPRLPEEEGDGLRVLSAPVELTDAIVARFPRHLKGAEQRYKRAYIAMEGTYEDYLARFSGKTRATLRRKQRKLEEASGGTLDLREYRSPQEIETFLALARPLAARTYQARLLDAALPDDAVFRAEALALAGQDRMRAFLLFLAGEPIAYLYLPVEGATLVYAYLGHDPAKAGFSPGTVLQLAALERLFAECRFAYFDFTEGEGAHKELFGTDAVECASFLLLEPTLANRLLLLALAGFERSMVSARSLSRATGIESTARKLLRT